MHVDAISACGYSPSHTGMKPTTEAKTMSRIAFLIIAALIIFLCLDRGPSAEQIALDKHCANQSGEPFTMKIACINHKTK